ncbi:hypothetical protein ACFV3R_16845 [Streptomyces sp. NPDC059740]|uniref:hypothetical protein n=1 Tax=Streptomyces sp. NPDC059740 TaxID=3346926 RepID=UPI00364D8627
MKKTLARGIAVAALSAAAVVPMAGAAQAAPAQSAAATQISGGDYDHHGKKCDHRRDDDSRWVCFCKHRHHRHDYDRRDGYRDDRGWDYGRGWNHDRHDGDYGRWGNIRGGFVAWGGFNF